MTKELETLGGAVTLNPERLKAHYKSEDFSITVSDVARVSKDEDGAMLVDIGTPLRASLVIDPRGYIYYKRADARPLPEEPKVTKEMVANGDTPKCETVLDTRPAVPKGSQRITLLGRMVHDPAIRDGQFGKFGNFTLASHDEANNTTYHKVNVSTKVVPQVEGFKKGDQAIVIGYPRTVEQKQQDGSKKQVEVIQASVVKKPKMPQVAQT